MHGLPTISELHSCNFVPTAKKIQLSQDAYNALTSFGCYVTTFRGEMEVKVRTCRDGDLVVYFDQH